MNATAAAIALVLLGPACTGTVLSDAGVHSEFPDYDMRLCVPQASITDEGTPWFRPGLMRKPWREPDYVSIVDADGSVASVALTDPTEGDTCNRWMEHDDLADGVYRYQWGAVGLDGGYYVDSGAWFSVARRGYYPWNQARPARPDNVSPEARHLLMSLAPASGDGFHALVGTLAFGLRPVPIRVDIRREAGEISLQNTRGEPLPTAGYHLVKVRAFGGVPWVLGHYYNWPSQHVATAWEDNIYAGRLADWPFQYAPVSAVLNGVCGLERVSVGGTEYVVSSNINNLQGLRIYGAPRQGEPLAFLEEIDLGNPVCGMTALDMDGDGNDELYATSQAGQGMVRLDFAPLAQQGSAPTISVDWSALSGLAWWDRSGLDAWHQIEPSVGDLDRDGRRDLFLANGTGLEVWLNRSTLGAVAFERFYADGIAAGSPSVAGFWLEDEQTTMLIGQGWFSTGTISPELLFQAHPERRWSTAFPSSRTDHPVHLLDLDGDGYPEGWQPYATVAVEFWWNADRENPPRPVRWEEALDGGQ